MNWEKLYSALKMTREGKGNIIMNNPMYRKRIADTITIKDIENMSKKDLQDAVISYLESIVPELH